MDVMDSAPSLYGRQGMVVCGTISVRAMVTSTQSIPLPLVLLITAEEDRGTRNRVPEPSL